MDPQCYSHLFYISYRRRSFLSVENKRISDVHMTDDRMINNHTSDDHIIADRISDDHIIADRMINSHISDDHIINDRISDDCFLSPLWSSEALLSVFLHSKKSHPASSSNSYTLLPAFSLSPKFRLPLRHFSRCVCSIFFNFALRYYPASVASSLLLLPLFAPFSSRSQVPSLLFS